METAHVTVTDQVQRTLLGESVDTMPVGILVKDDDGKLLAANQMACDLFGYTRAELLALPEHELTVRSEERISEVGRTLATNGELRGTVPIRRADGTVIDLDYIAMRCRLAHMHVFVSLISPSPSSLVALVMPGAGASVQ